MVDHRVYGLRVRSPWRLRGCAPAFGGRPDIVLRRVGRPLGPSGSGTWFQHSRCADGADWVSWRGLGEFLVSADGRSILARTLGARGSAAFQSYLLGQVLSFALVRRGLEPLHATAVVLRGTAVGFLGGCGQGKSTLAAAFLARGARLLTDDLLVLRERHGAVLAHAGPARLKLFPSVARRVLGRFLPAPRLNPGTAKRIIPLGPHHRPPAAPRPLRACYVLRPRRSGAIRLRTLGPRQAMLALLGATFNPLVLDPARHARLLDHAVWLVRRVPVRELVYPRGLDRLEDVCRAVEADLTG